MLRWIAVGTVLQTAMVVVGHWVAAVADLFGPLGVVISLAGSRARAGPTAPAAARWWGAPAP